MRKLLAANFFRLRKDALFKVALLSVLLCSLLGVWMCYNGSKMDLDTIYYVEDMLFNMLPAIGFVLAFFLSLHMGVEMDEHTIRNKLIVGHTRCEVFFAQYFSSLAAALILLLALLLPAGAAGLILFGRALLTGTNLFYLIFCCMLFTAVFSAMFTAISMNTSSRAAAMALCVLFLLGLFLLSSYCGNALFEPETTYSSVSISVDEIQYGELIHNPAYVSGLQRTIYEWIYDALPTGQCIQIHDLNMERAGRWPLLSLALLMLFTFAGYLPFGRRDLK